MIDDDLLATISYLSNAFNRAKKAGLGPHFCSDVSHLLSTAQFNYDERQKKLKEKRAKDETDTMKA